MSVSALFPKRDRLKDAILTELSKNGGQARSRDVIAALTIYFQPELSEEAMALREKDGAGGLEWDHQLRWARFHLVKEQLLQKGGQGIWELTTNGWTAAPYPSRS